MLLAVIIFVFFLMHIQFLLRNLLFGVHEGNFFIFTIEYIFDRATALSSLYFSIACALAFAIGYLLLYRFGRVRRSSLLHPEKGTRYLLPLWPLILSGIFQFFVILNILVSSGFSYHVIAIKLEGSGFLTELRLVFLLLVAHLSLNVPLGEIVKRRRYRIVRCIVLAYIVALFLLQARSRIFEILAIFGFSYLAWNNDKIKLKYFLFLGLGMIVPNLVVLARLGPMLDFETIKNGIFSFEYSILFNNMLSAAISDGPIRNDSFTFSGSLGLIIPSPIRSAFGISVEKNDFYQYLSNESNVSNGGFSLLAELFANFGWGSVVVMFITGGLIGFLNSRALRVGRVSIYNSAAPLLYVAFLLSFRNDLGVLIKYSVQLFFIALIFNFLIIAATVRRARSSHSLC